MKCSLRQYIAPWFIALGFVGLGSSLFLQPNLWETVGHFQYKASHMCLQPHKSMDKLLYTTSSDNHLVMEFDYEKMKVTERRWGDHHDPGKSRDFIIIDNST